MVEKGEEIRESAPDYQAGASHPGIHEMFPGIFSREKAVVFAFPLSIGMYPGITALDGLRAFQSI